MRIHVLSDLHNEFSPFMPVVADADVVVLAGDIDVKGRGVPWARDAFACPVLYVPGNHEYYGGHLARTLAKMREAADERVRVMECDEVVIGGARFLGATGWTDYSATGSPALAEWDARQTMVDFRKIRTGDTFRKTRPADYAERARRTKQWLREQLAQPFAGPTVIITHHAPSVVSLKKSPFSGSHLDASYANRWEDLMGGTVDLWIHGHSHQAVDYEIANTRVLSNPRGYPDEHTGFDAALVAEVLTARPAENEEGVSAPGVAPRGYAGAI